MISAMVRCLYLWGCIEPSWRCIRLIQCSCTCGITPDCPGRCLSHVTPVSEKYCRTWLMVGIATLSLLETSSCANSCQLSISLEIPYLSHWRHGDMSYGDAICQSFIAMTHTTPWWPILLPSHSFIPMPQTTPWFPILLPSQSFIAMTQSMPWCPILLPSQSLWTLTYLCER